MAKALKLQYSDNQPIYIIGILSSSNQLKLSWALNQLLNIKLSIKDKVILNHNKTSQTSEHTIFQYDDEGQILRYSLISNKNGSFYFVDELKNIDYMFIVKGECDDSYRILINNLLRNVPEIITTINIIPENIKRRDRLDLF